MISVTVSELVGRIRHLVEGQPDFQHLWVTGEVSGAKHHTSGHWYFVLKDATSQIRSVMFRRDALSLSAPLKDGAAVMAYGRVGVFERDGQTQFYVSMVKEVGLGTAAEALEALKQRLYQEGLFSRPKRPLPRLPRAVGVVTSGSGAARFDIETVVTRRYPGMPLVLYPVQVQGQGAGAAIAEAVRNIQREPIDVLIVGRGGGSREDLMAFNQEVVVRAVSTSRVPVISAVGHEIDTTLVDLASDMRAPTPSAAAELAVPELAQLKESHQLQQNRVRQALWKRLSWERDRLTGWTSHGLLANPHQLWREYRHHLDRWDERLERTVERRLVDARHRVERLTGSLLLLDPRAPLERGYAYVTATDGSLVTADRIQWDEMYEVHWYNGSHWMKRDHARNGKKDHDGGAS